MCVADERHDAAHDCRSYHSKDFTVEVLARLSRSSRVPTRRSDLDTLMAALIRIELGDEGPACLPWLPSCACACVGDSQVERSARESLRQT